MGFMLGWRFQWVSSIRCNGGLQLHIDMMVSNHHGLVPATYAVLSAMVYFFALLVNLTSPWAVCAQTPTPNSTYHFAAENLATGAVIQRGTSPQAGIPQGNLILAPETNFRFWLFDAATGQLGFKDFRTPTAGQRFTIPPVPLGLPLLRDSDNDGLTDDAEFIVGTDPLNPDTNNDDVTDGAAIQLGLDASNARTGVIGSALAPGTALDVCAVNDVAVLACGSAGAVVFNVFNRMSPVRIAQVDTPGNALRVSCSGTLLAVADGRRDSWSWTSPIHPMPSFCIRWASAPPRRRSPPPVASPTSASPTARWRPWT